MKTIFKSLVPALAVVSCNFAFAQNYIPYHPSDWEFKTNVDLVDFSRVKEVRSRYMTIDENEEYPVFETGLSWNNTYQLNFYSFSNYNQKNGSFDVRFDYTDPNSNRLKSISITSPVTHKLLEKRQYVNGPFDIEKITVQTVLENLPEPNVFEVKYEGNDDDYLEETVYTPEKAIDRQTKTWYQPAENGKYRLVKKIYTGKKLSLDQTDSLILDQEQKKLALYEINFGIAGETLYRYKTRKVKINGGEQELRQLEAISKNGVDTERYEYEYDTKGNWISQKTYRMKNGKWEYDKRTTREILYR